MNGCMEANLALHEALRESAGKSRSLAAAFIDISKAFDYLSFDTILRSARSFGAPPLLMTYIRNIYTCGEAILYNCSIHNRRGVRQGDPLSPILFIMAMDKVLLAADPSSGFPLGSTVRDAVAYADDLVLFAEDSSGLSAKLTAADAALARAGMLVNIKKSMSMTILANRKVGNTALAPIVYRLEEESLLLMEVDTVVRYLGLEFSWRGKTGGLIGQELVTYLNRITRAPLKPCQRMEILLIFLVPEFLHQLVLQTVKRRVLRRLHVQIRGAVRRWLKLPKDAVNGLLHTPSKAGGLGIPCLSVLVPLLQRERFAKLVGSPHSTVREVAMQEGQARILHAVNQPVSVGGIVVCTKEEAAAAWRALWLSSSDGRDLAIEPMGVESTSWVSHPGKMFSRLYIRSIQLRAGCLYTHVRSSRGARLVEVNCSGVCVGSPSLNTSFKRVLRRTRLGFCARTRWLRS
ncbi:unnamed protein product [Dicrocoelium dendriticum]|nr:unnamed protein product [Dicrocoelium dendriticum]